MLNEQDFIDKMIELLENGPEFMDQVQCVFFTWNEFFNVDDDEERAAEVANQVYDTVYPESTLEERLAFLIELASILK